MLQNYRIIALLSIIFNKFYLYSPIVINNAMHFIINVLNGFENGNAISVLFCGLSNAFGCVKLHILFDKLHKYEIGINYPELNK